MSNVEGGEKSNIAVSTATYTLSDTGERVYRVELALADSAVHRDEQGRTVLSLPADLAYQLAVSIARASSITQARETREAEGAGDE